MDENPAEGQQINWCVVLSLPNYVGWNIIANHKYCYHVLMINVILYLPIQFLKLSCLEIDGDALNSDASPKQTWGPPLRRPTKNQELQAYLHCAQLVDLQRGGPEAALGWWDKTALQYRILVCLGMWYID